MDDKKLLYQKQLEEKKSEKIQNKVVEFYEENLCKMKLSYQMYQNYINNKSDYINDDFVKCTKDEFIKYLSNKNILIITANPIEEAILIVSLFQYNDNKISCYLIDNIVFHVVNINGSTIIHSHAERTGDEFTRRSINEATKLFKPDYIILLGVCYGIDSDKNSLGDAIISDFVLGYRINFRDSETEEIIIEPEVEFNEEPSKALIDKLSKRFSYSMIMNHTFSCFSSKESITPHIGKLISANSLMSSKLVKESILKKLGDCKPRVVAGEMETCGIFKSNYFSEESFNKWIVLKSICDWGEGKNLLSLCKEENDLIKDSIQAFAMINSWEILRFILDKNLL